MATFNWPGFGIAAVTPTLDQPAQVNRSAYTGVRAVASNPWHGKWSFKVQLAVRQGDSAFQAIRAFFTQLQGSVNNFHLPAIEAPQNANTGVTLSASAGQGATSLALTGLTTALVPGNMVTIAGQLLSLTAVGSLSGSAQTINFQPALRAAAASAASIETAKPYALVALTGSTFSWDIAQWRQYGLSFDVDEDVGGIDGASPSGDTWNATWTSGGGSSGPNVLGVAVQSNGGTLSQVTSLNIVGGPVSIVGSAATISVSGARSVKEFGACGAGGDDLAVFTLAINALNAGTITTLYIPSGSYNLSAALSIISRGGVSIRGDGKRNTLLRPQGNFDCLTIRSTTPTGVGSAGRVADLTIGGFGIDYGAVTAPTAGVGLTLDRLERCFIDVEVNSAYQGLLIRGGADNHFGQSTISGAYSWTGVATGSYIAKFSYYPGTTEVPSEWFFPDVNWKGSNAFLDTAIIIECCDGLFFGIGHVGFAQNRQLWINPQATAALSLQNFNSGSVYFDGNNSGSASGSMVEISGSTLPVCQGIDFSSSTFANGLGKGLYSTLTSLQDLRVVGAQFSQIGKEHVDITGAIGFALNSNTFRNGNSANTGTAQVKLTSCSRGTATGNRLLPGANYHPKGFDLTSVVDCSVTGNTVHAATDFSVNTGCDRIRFAGNLKDGQSVTVASAAALAFPMGFETVTVTGTTGITSFTSQAIEDYQVTLNFASTAGMTTINNVKLAGNVAFNPTANSSISFICKAGVWYETGRAII